MSNLIPTPQTDKNGVTSIRHMRQRSNYSVSAAAIPPVSISATTQSASGIGKRLSDLVAGDPRTFPNLSGMITELDIMTKGDPSLVEAIDAFTSTGSQGAQKATSMYLANHVRLTSHLPQNLKKTDPQMMVARLKEIWHGENVAEESGHVGEIDFSKESTTSIMDVRQIKSFNDEQWRGFAVYRLAFESPGGSPPSSVNLIRFINWAGRQERLSQIIRFAKERGTSNPETLQALVYAPGSDSALREGLL